MRVEGLVTLAVELGPLFLGLLVVALARSLQRFEFSVVELLDFVLELFKGFLLFGPKFFFNDLLRTDLVLNAQLVFAHSFVLGHAVLLPVGYFGRHLHFPIDVSRVHSRIVH